MCFKCTLETMPPCMHDHALQPNGVESDDGNNDPVCIVGIGCHLPGDIRSPSALWDFLLERKSAQGRLPSQRFNIEGFHSPNRNIRGTLKADGGYFLSQDVRMFDNNMFGINTLEATYMDPQQRKLLEVVFECFENAGVSIHDISGSNTGVYVGNFTVDYQTMQMRDPDYLQRYSATGLGTAILSNRISHVFNLHGPSLTLDTACSSTMYCFHSAVRSLQAGDCDGAIVAGANLITSPEQHLGTAMAGVLSPRSTCCSFDESADGYGRAEGINAVYLKRYSSALEHGDRIWAIVRSCAVNSNGRTAGITQPSATLQEAVIRKAYAQANLQFSDTDYIECHGTGTAVGDPIEVDGLARCFSTTDRSTPLMIGAVKTNFGHSEAASGLTSIIKVALAFKNKMIPPTWGPSNISPKLHLKSNGMRVVTESQDWPRSIRRAGINSFGYGGANAHIILESLESYSSKLLHQSASQPKQSWREKQFVIPVSAASSTSMEWRKTQVKEEIRRCDEERLRRLAFTLTMRRSHLPFRDFFVVGDTKKANSWIVTEGKIADSPSFSTQNPLPFAFVFTGQGAQYAGMGKELLRHNTTFRSTIRQLDKILQALPPQFAASWSLETSILDESRVDEAARSQPLCTAIQIALVAVLHSWGIEPSAIIGHSSGEIGAAYAAGLLNATQALLVAYFRGYVVSQTHPSGAMLVTSMNAESANQLIQKLKLGAQVCVACINAPESVTLSGSHEGIDILLQRLHDQKLFARKLRTGGQAYHSPMMKEVGSLYEGLLIPYFSSRIPTEAKAAKVFSSVYPSQDSTQININMDAPQYWKSNLELPVQFSSATNELLASGDYHWIEIGPHPALKSLIQKSEKVLGKKSTPYSSTLERNCDSNMAMKQLAGSLFLHGHKVNWCMVNDLSERGIDHLDDLAPYPWDYSDGLLWREPRPSQELRARKFRRHELLGSQQVAGNAIDWSWRNVLFMDEVPWLCDHKIEKQVVFPAAGYLTMAMEAISQIRCLKLGQPRHGALFEFSNVNVRSALIVPQQTSLECENLELHTTMAPKKLSTAASSNDWYDFTISSWQSGLATVHCVGSICLRTAAPHISEFTASHQNQSPNPVNIEVRSMDEWYSTLEEEGLSYGPHFRALSALSTDGNRQQRSAICTLKLDRKSTSCATQVIALDACLQAAIISDSAGVLSMQKAWLPIFIPFCQSRFLDPTLVSDDATVSAHSIRSGISTLHGDSTLYGETDKPLVHFKGVKLTLYIEKLDSETKVQASHQQRHPCLQVQWKPDLRRLQPGANLQINQYIRKHSEKFRHYSLDDESLPVIGAIIDLAAHKTPQLRVLEIGNSSTLKSWVDRSTKEPDFLCYSFWQVTRFNSEGKLVFEEQDTKLFDVVLVSMDTISKDDITKIVGPITAHLSESGIVAIRRHDNAMRVRFDVAGLTTFQLDKNVLLAMPKQASEKLEGRSLVFVYLNPSEAILEFVSSLVAIFGQSTSISEVSSVSILELDKVVLSEDTICISMIEIEHDFLSRMDQTHMDLMRRITNTVSNLLWLTGGTTPNELNPNLSLVNGLSRALMLERPRLRFAVMTINIPDALGRGLMSTFNNILNALVSQSNTDDKEFSERDGLIYISRFVPWSETNQLFRRRLGWQQSAQPETLADAKLARLAIGKVGVTNSIYFQQLREPVTPIPAGFVDIAVKAISLNAKDVYVLNGRTETRKATTGLEFSGVVTAVGNESRLEVGDRVVVLAPNHMTTTERIPAWAAHKILPDEDFRTMATLPVAYATALYALRHRACLQAGESVLIHCGSGALGIAAITMAKLIGAVVYTTSSSRQKRDYISNSLGIPQSRVFNSRDESFVSGVMTATDRRGVDVVLNSLVGDLMHASWNCIANFGRFVEVGKRELVDAGKLDMSVFARNATFIAFDLSELFYHEQQSMRDILFNLLKEVLQMYRAGDIMPGPITSFDVSEIGQAYRFFSSNQRIGKVVVSLEDESSRIPICPSKYITVFDPSKIYLCIGCLGGLGRSLCRWMLARGARHFVFLGRSGSDNVKASQLVSSLTSAGASATVIRGDVVKADDVNAAVAACRPRQIGGVVHAAMGLHESLFTHMTSDAWHTAIQPKVAGAWNIHHALEAHGQDEGLDFFLLTSSVSGSVGTATESNYCAANAFLDSFARWRRTKGKPAVSVGLGMISEVGYLNENPEIEALLLRRGIQPLSEDEFLQIIDLALAHETRERDPQSSHILTGLEPFKTRELLTKGFDVSHSTMQDPRASLIASAFQGGSQTHKKNNTELPGIDQLPASHWLRSLPTFVASAMATEVNTTSLHGAVIQVITKQFSNLMLISPEKINIEKPLLNFGVDSMIASEFRMWFWTVFRVDVPFLDILNSQQCLRTLSESVADKLAHPTAVKEL
ncbi:putative polyketide synthase [Xylaria sp. FL1042]|nr:putative polyketide synthase [Xylaria sp. FL1042]